MSEDQKIPPGDIPRSGGYLSDVGTVVNIRAAQVHAAVGIGGDPDSKTPDFDEKIPMVFIIGGLSMGNERLNPRGQVAVGLEPTTALAMIHACLMGLLSQEGVDAAMSRIYELGHEEHAKDLTPALFVEAKAAQDSDLTQEGLSFDSLLRKTLQAMIERGELPGDVSDYTGEEKD